MSFVLEKSFTRLFHHVDGMAYHIKTLPGGKFNARRSFYFVLKRSSVAWGWRAAPRDGKKPHEPPGYVYLLCCLNK